MRLLYVPPGGWLSLLAVCGCYESAEIADAAATDDLAAPPDAALAEDLADLAMLIEAPDLVCPVDNCSGVCTNRQIDPANCGACGRVCSTATGSLCVQGRCVLCADDSCRVAFVSSTKFNGNLGGLDGGDAKCQALATAAGLYGSFRAWLSSGSISAAMRLVHSAVPYVRTDGVRVADDWAELTSLTLDATINHDEAGRAVSALTTIAWTGTLGTGAGAPTHCTDWSDGTNAVSGRSGILDDIDDEWTNTTNTPCDTPAALYCLEQ